MVVGLGDSFEEETHPSWRSYTQLTRMGSGGADCGVLYKEQTSLGIAGGMSLGLAEL